MTQPLDFDETAFAAIATTLFTDGFAAVPDFLTADDVDEVRGLITPWIDGEIKPPPSTQRSVARNDLGDGEATSVPIVELTNLAALDPRLAQTRFFRKALAMSQSVFGRGVRFRFDHAIDKSAHNPQPTRWHQDCAYSSRLTLSARKLHWWLPLQAVGVDNGCMQFARGSHRRPVLPHVKVGVTGHARSTTTPDPAEVTACPLPLGGVTIHLPKTLHYTGPNLSDARRLAWVVHMGVRAWPPTLL